MNSNTKLNVAKVAKADEFYTQYEDIEKEVSHYTEYFKEKVVFCNCDNPYWSNFFSYFVINFRILGLKKLICTCYDNSEELENSNTLMMWNTTKKSNSAYKVEITLDILESLDKNIVSLEDVHKLLNVSGVVTKLKGDGDFRSAECIELLKESDIVVTNPPFSLFREFISLITSYNKKFLVLGNQNAITSKNIIPLICENELWFGYSIHSGDRWFRVPDTYTLDANSCKQTEQGDKYIAVTGVRWFTNLDYAERHIPLELSCTYDKIVYLECENCEAINVDKTADIPMDYEGVMAVPITFFDKWCPEQFDVLGFITPIINGKAKYKRLLIKRKNGKI